MNGSVRVRLPLIVAGAIVGLAAPSAVRAHGGGVPPAPDLPGLLFGWSLDANIWLPLLALAAIYLLGVRRVNRLHPNNPVPRDRPAWFLFGLAMVAVALQSGIERWDTTLFSVHMVQHLVLVFLGALFLVLGAPITLLLRAATPEVRRRRILPLLNSRVVRVVGHPLVAWVAFAAIMWGSHVSPLFDAALEDEFLHFVEHGLYLSSAILFWLPVIGRDPGPYRIGYPARLGFLFLQMPLNSFLGVVILFSEQVLYPHYATTGRPWGPTPLEDQQLAGAIMWGGGDTGFLLALMLVIAAWMRSEETSTRRREAAEDAQAAAAVAVTAHDDAANAGVTAPG